MTNDLNYNVGVEKSAAAFLLHLHFYAAESLQRVLSIK